MQVKFFGQYLLDKRVIDREQLLDALDYQEEHNIRFGGYAVEKGYLTADQLAELREMQKQQDMRVGELAIRKNYLTPEKVQEILVKQRNDYVPLGEALVEKGHLSKEDLGTHLAAFEDSQGKAMAASVRVEESLRDAPALGVLADLTEKMFHRVVQIPVKTPGVLKKRAPEEGLEVNTAIRLHGDIDMEYLLVVTKDVARSIYQSLVHEDPESDQDLKDGLAEFANIVAGNGVTKLAQMGLDVQMDPPQQLAKDDVWFKRSWGGHGECPLFTPAGEIRLHILMA